MARRLAHTKAQTAQRNAERDPELANAFILAADTVVAVGRRILPKPEFTDEAAACLRLLSGRGHRVYGALCLITPKGKVQEPHRRDALRFKRLSREEIETYLASGEWEGKAGGYAIQGRAGGFVTKLVGSYTNVVGLRALRDDGAALRRGLPGLRPLGDPDVSGDERPPLPQPPDHPARPQARPPKNARSAASRRPRSTIPSARSAAPTSTSTAGSPGRMRSRARGRTRRRMTPATETAGVK